MPHSSEGTRRYSVRFGTIIDVHFARTKKPEHVTCVVTDVAPEGATKGEMTVGRLSEGEVGLPIIEQGGTIARHEIIRVVGALKPRAALNAISRGLYEYARVQPNEETMGYIKAAMQKKRKRIKLPITDASVK
jgi:hypothetical protein